MEGEKREKGSVIEDTATPAEKEMVVADSVDVGKRGKEGKRKKKCVSQEVVQHSQKQMYSSRMFHGHY